MTTDTSPRFDWIRAVRQREERRARTAKLRADLVEARTAGKRIRHQRRLAQRRTERR